MLNKSDAQVFSKGGATFGAGFTDVGLTSTHRVRLQACNAFNDLCC